MSKYIFTLLLLLLLTVVRAQSPLRPVGSWSMFTPSATSISVTDAGNKIYSTTSYSILEVDKTTNEITTLNKVNALSDYRVSLVRYNPHSKQTLVLYTNSNIDVIDSVGQISNIADFKNSNIPGDKTIYHIFFENNHAYLSSGLFILDVDMIRKEVTANYVIGNGGSNVKVNSFSADDSFFYAASDEGLKRASKSSINLQDFSEWVTVSSISNLPSGSSQHVFHFNEVCFTVINDSLFKRVGTEWYKMLYMKNTHIADAQTENGRCVLTLHLQDDSGSYLYTRLMTIDTAYDTTRIISSGIGFASTAIQEMNGDYWVADNWLGLTKITSSGYKHYSINSPPNNQFFKLHIENQSLYIAPGAINSSYQYLFIQPAYYIYNEGWWRAENKYTEPLLDEYFDIIAVAANPLNTEVAYGSYYAGLVLDRDGVVSTYNQNNSLLRGAVGDELRSRVSGLQYDEEGNLWIANYGASKPIVVKKPDDTWLSFSATIGFSRAKFVFIDSYNQKWIPSNDPPNYGLLVYSHGDDINTSSDDSYKLLSNNAGQGNLTDVNVYAIAEDKNGEIWVGTRKGISVFSCKENILTSEGCDSRIVYAERDGFTRPIFEEERVNAIAIDGANRKWIGTNNGLYLLSATGEEQLLQYTTDNSPLPSNVIIDIAVNQQSGEVFIATEAGLVSYMSDATQGETTADSTLYIYPNPVQHNYTGVVAIKKLAEGSYVKITDVSGGLIQQGYANGGMFTWDLNNYEGKRAATGTYIIWVSNEDASEKAIGKMVIIH